MVKCIKVEFELTEVWQGQGWFGAIDALLRGKQYGLAQIDIEFSRPASARSIYHPGEPLWGKAIYVLSPARWSRRAGAVEAAVFEDDLLKATTLYVILDIPGRSLDLLNQFGAQMARAQDIASSIMVVFKYAKVDAVRRSLAARLRWLFRV